MKIKGHSSAHSAYQPQKSDGKAVNLQAYRTTNCWLADIPQRKYSSYSATSGV